MRIEQGSAELEVKSRGSARGNWGKVAGWMEHKSPDVLVLLEDFREPLVVLTWEVFAKLVERAGGIPRRVR